MKALAPLLGCLLVCAPAAAGPRGGRAATEAAVAEASTVFRLPPALIWRVIGRESAGNPRAVSRAGAIGLMQIMPTTWAELRARLGLGSDAFDPHDNILAGAAYLREMLDRFGAPGFLAAYNAGPGRYAEVLAGRAPLPAETRAYVARLGATEAAAAAPLPRPRAAGLTPVSAGLFPLQVRGEP